MSTSVGWSRSYLYVHPSRVDTFRYLDTSISMLERRFQRFSTCCAVTIIHFCTPGIPHTLLAQVREAYIVAGTLVTATNLQVGAILRCSFTIQLVCPRCIEVLVLADIIVSKLSTIAYILVVAAPGCTSDPYRSDSVPGYGSSPCCKSSEPPSCWRGSGEPTS